MSQTEDYNLEDSLRLEETERNCSREAWISAWFQSKEIKQVMDTFLQGLKKKSDQHIKRVSMASAAGKGVPGLDQD